MPCLFSTPEGYCELAKDDLDDEMCYNENGECLCQYAVIPHSNCILYVIDPFMEDPDMDDIIDDIFK